MSLYRIEASMPFDEDGDVWSVIQTLRPQRRVPSGRT